MAAVLCAIVLLAPPMDARTRRGDKLLKEGAKAEAAQDYDKALTFYEQALEEDAREPAYQLATQRAKSKAAAQHLAQGRKLVEQQKLDEGLVQFQKALLIDPSSPVSLQLVTQTDAMIKERNRAPEGTVILTPAERARRDVERRINSLEGPPVLRPINNQISSLKMNNQSSRVIYESVGKLAGINVLFDPSGIDTMGSSTRNFNLDLNNVTLEEALTYIALVTHTFWKPISRNAIFVTQESEPKRQEYQDEVVKVFYIQNAGTTAEFQDIFNAVRIGSKLSQGLFQVGSQNAILARGTPDTMSLIEKIVHDLDRPKAEVLIDVMVWEVSKSKITNLGMALQGTNILSVSPGSPSATTTSTTGTSGTTSTTSSGAISLSRIGKLSTNDFSLTLPGAVAQALLTDSNSKLLQNPQVRVTDGGKGSLKIGSKIPYVSGSLNSAVATPGSIPYATTQFQQIDVGVNIDVEPHVNGPNDVSMHIKVEISSVTGTNTIAGVAQPIIGQKVNEANVRMRDGEYSLLGGLSSDSDALSVGGLPGVSNIPVLGYLFGTKQRDREKDDILIALVPHIIRAPAVDEQTPEGILAGTERSVRVERKLQPAAQPQPGLSVPTQPVAPGAQQAPPPLPPPGGQAELLPPTNNPKMVSPAGAQAQPLEGRLTQSPDASTSTAAPKPE
jgi:general secretion pathway protein D